MAGGGGVEERCCAGEFAAETAGQEDGGVAGGAVGCVGEGSGEGG